MKPVLMNDFKIQWENIQASFMEAISKVGSSGYLILGPEVSAFEKNLANFWGIENAVGCANGMDALEIGLRCLGIKSGDTVLTTPLSAFATTLAILKVGAIPVFIDTDENGLIDLDVADDFLSKNLQTKFFIPVHLYGHCLNLEKLLKLKNNYGLKIVEDCAQSIGAKYQKSPCGTIGQVAATSFYPTKNLGCYGDGGALLTSDKDLHDIAFKIRDYGQSQKYVHSLLGLNSRLDEVQAAVLNTALLPKLEYWTQRRRHIANKYLQNITNKNIILPRTPEHSESVWHLFPLRIPKNRDSFMSFLKENGVSNAIHYPILIPDQPIFKNENSANITYKVFGELKNANLYAQQEVSIPIHPFLTDMEIERVIQVCNEWKC